MFSWDDCMFNAVLRPNTEPIVTASGITTKDPWGSMATRQALRIEGESAAEIPHMRHTSLSCLLIVCSEHSPRRILQSFSSPWPSRPKRPMTTLQGRDVIWTIPRHHSHSFCSPILRADTLLFRDLLGKAMFTTQVSSNSPCRSVQDAKSQRWS